MSMKASARHLRESPAEDPEAGSGLGPGPGAESPRGDSGGLGRRPASTNACRARANSSISTSLKVISTRFEIEGREDGIVFRSEVRWLVLGPSVMLREVRDAQPATCMPRPG